MCAGRTRVTCIFVTLMWYLKTDKTGYAKMITHHDDLDESIIKLVFVFVSTLRSVL